MSSALPEATVELEISVRFAETDLMGVVHHGVYAVWLEAGRIAWMNAAGVPYVEVARGGHNFAVTRLAIDYRTPARFGDVIRVATCLCGLQSRKALFSYEVVNAETGSLLATAQSDHICVDSQTRVVRIPVEVADGMRAGARAIALRGYDRQSVGRNRADPNDIR